MMLLSTVAAGAGAGAELRSLAAETGGEHDSRSAVSSAVRQHRACPLGTPPARLGGPLAAAMRQRARDVPLPVLSRG